MSQYTAAIQKLYVAYFNRPADVSGLHFWEAVAARQGGTAAVAAAFAREADYRNQYTGMAPGAVVDAVFQKLFGRPADEGGKKFWADALASGATTLDRIVTDISGGAQGADKAAFDSKAAAAQALTDALATLSFGEPYVGASAMALGRAFLDKIVGEASLKDALAGITTTVAAIVTNYGKPLAFTLTPNADTGAAFTGGNGDDVFQATGATFSAGDQLAGGAGLDVLAITDVTGALASGAPAGVRLDGVEGVQIEAVVGGVGSAATPFDASGFAGLQKLGVRMQAGAGVHVKLPAGAAFEVVYGIGATVAGSGQVQSLAAYGARGPITVDSTTSGHTLALRLFNYSLYDDAGGAITDATAGTVDLSVLDAKDTPMLYSQVAVDGYDNSNVRLNAPLATTLNIVNRNVLRLHTDAMAVNDRLATVTLAGAGATEADFRGIDSVKTVDATAASGRNTLVVSAAALESYRGGSGVDEVTLLGGVHANVALGAGNDVLRLDTAVAAGARIDGGAGADTVVLANPAMLDANAVAALSGFEVLGIGGTGSYDLSALTGIGRVAFDASLKGDIAVTGAGSGTALDFVVNGTASATFDRISYAQRDATGAHDTLAVTLSGVDAGFAGRRILTVTDLSANGIETIEAAANIRIEKAINPFMLPLLVNAPNFTSTIVTLHADSATRLALSGIASVEIGALDTPLLATIDASAALGNVTIGTVSRAPGQAKLAYLGGAGIDKLAAGATPVSFQGNGGDDDVTLGAGADTVVYARASDSRLTFGKGIVPSLEGGDTVRGFATGVDKIDLAQLGLANGYARGAMLAFALQTDSREALAAVVRTGEGFFRDAGGSRALAWVGTADGNGYLLADIDGDGSFVAGKDFAIHLVGGSPVALGDVAFGV